jgi:hypothetical protein
MVGIKKKEKRSANDAGLIPLTNDNDAFVIQLTRKTKVEQYNEDAFEDQDDDQITDSTADIDQNASHYDGQFLVKDDDTGKVLVFTSLHTANERAAQKWESMQTEKINGFDPAPENEQEISTRSPRKKVLTDGRFKFSRKQKVFVADEILEEIQHTAISNITVEVIMATLVS